MWTGEKGRREETNRREREAGCQVLPLRRELTKMQLSTPSSMYLQTLKIRVSRGSPAMGQTQHFPQMPF